MDEQYYNKAINFLARRPRSEKEIRDYLQKKKAPEEKIELILSRLRQKKFINDYEFAIWWIEQRTRFKTMGKRAIEIELKSKSINTEIIEELRGKYQELRGKSERELAMDIVQKNIKKYQGLSRQELYTKLGGFLSRRGFDFDTIKACIDEVLKI